MNYFDGVAAEIGRNPPKPPWKKHFAWWPVYIDGTRYWFKTVYRRQLFVEGTGIQWGYEYGTIFDVVKGNDELLR